MLVKGAFFFFGWRDRLRAFTSIASKTDGRRPWFLLPGLLSLCFFMPGCGGGDQRTVAPPNALAQRLVGANEIPDLALCLGRIGAALRKEADQAASNFNCATGTYQGLTNEGRHCMLKIDGLARSFFFQVEQQAVAIKWEIVAHAADGSPVDNLEDASAPAQPGIQLTRFTGTQIPLTEALILRLSAGAARLPEMIYQRSEDSVTKFITCKFGK